MRSDFPMPAWFQTEHETASPPGTFLNCLHEMVLGRTAHAAVHGSTISIPMSSKSRTLRVATAMSRDAAIAAI